MALVVDASAVAAVLYREPEGDTIRAHLRGEALIAPQLIDYEIASVSLKKMRRSPAQAEAILALLSALPSLSITRVAVPVPEVTALAMTTGLSAYDASYLWLAMSRDAELVTLDGRLAAVNQTLREPD